MSKKEYVSWFVWVGRKPGKEAKHILAESRREAIAKSRLSGDVHAKKSSATTR